MQLENQEGLLKILPIKMLFKKNSLVWVCFKWIQMVFTCKSNSILFEFYQGGLFPFLMPFAFKVPHLILLKLENACKIDVHENGGNLATKRGNLTTIIA